MAGGRLCHPPSTSHDESISLLAFENFTSSNTLTVSGASNVLFSIPHQATGGGGTTYPVYYGTDLSASLNMSVFNNIYGPGVEDGTRIWDWSHETAGGYDGRNYMRFYRWSDEDGDPDTGFYFTPDTLLAPQVVADLAPGPLYVRFRMKTTEYLGAGGHSAGMKWFIFGGPGISGERRMIFWVRNGLAYSGVGESLYGQGGTLIANSVLDMTAGVSGNRANCLMPNAEWVHIQLAWAYTGASGGPYMRIYVNNNTIGSPDAEHTAFTSDGMGGVWSYPEGWDTGHWADIVSTGSTSDRDAQIDFMDMEFGTSFDASWYPG